jgi:UDP-sugar pyrophosphorylase
MLDRWLTFSPAKNALESGPDATLAAAESDLYVSNQRKLTRVGVHVETTNTMETFAGVPVTHGPRIVLGAAFGLTQDDLTKKITGYMSITERSSLVLDGQHLRIKNLQVDGALVVRCGAESYVTIDGLAVHNQGWELVELDGAKDYPEHVRVRGYTMTKHETAHYNITEPGHFMIGADGQVQKVVAPKDGAASEL